MKTQVNKKKNLEKQTKPDKIDMFVICFLEVYALKRDDKLSFQISMEQSR